LLLLSIIHLATADCLTDPANPTCVNYTIPRPTAQTDVNNLCTGMMSNMPGCTINRLCQPMPNDPNCNPFTTLKLICDGNMKMMGGCKAHYNTMCNSSSIIKECSVQALPVPSGEMLINKIQLMCSQMPMDGCNLCGNTSLSCDALTVYSQICLQMPDTAECSMWRNLCKNISTWPLCATTTPGALPEMQMYFHFGFTDYILFKDWIPQNSTQYYLAIAGIFILALIYEALRTARALFEAQVRVHTVMQQQQQLEQIQSLLPPEARMPHFDCVTELSRSIFRGAEFILSYFMMLIAMTFNVGFCIALVAGVVTGTFLFGRFQFPQVTTVSRSLNEPCH